VKICEGPECFILTPVLLTHFLQVQRIRRENAVGREHDGMRAMRELEPGTLRLNHGLPVKAYHGPSILESQEECGLVPDEPKFYSKGRLLVTRPDSSTRSQSSNDHSYITVEICLFICEGGRTSHRSEVTVFLLPNMARGGDKR